MGKLRMFIVDKCSKVHISRAKKEAMMQYGKDAIIRVKKSTKKGLYIVYARKRKK